MAIYSKHRTGKNLTITNISSENFIVNVQFDKYCCSSCEDCSDCNFLNILDTVVVPGGHIDIVLNDGKYLVAIEKNNHIIDSFEYNIYEELKEEVIVNVFDTFCDDCIECKKPKTCQQEKIDSFINDQSSIESILTYSLLKGYSNNAVFTNYLQSAFNYYKCDFVTTGANQRNYLKYFGRHSDKYDLFGKFAMIYYIGFYLMETLEDEINATSLCTSFRITEIKTCLNKYGIMFGKLDELFKSFLDFFTEKPVIINSDFYIDLPVTGQTPEKLCVEDTAFLSANGTDIQYSIITSLPTSGTLFVTDFVTGEEFPVELNKEYFTPFIPGNCTYKYVPNETSNSENPYDNFTFKVAGEEILLGLKAQSEYSEDGVISIHTKTLGNSGSVTTMADQYTPVGANLITSIGVTPPITDGIANKNILPIGTTYTWETTPVVSAAGIRPAVIVVTYSDGSRDKVGITIETRAAISYSFTKGIYLNQTDRGTISGTENGNYVAGYTISISATASAGFRFVRWRNTTTGAKASASPQYTFGMPVGGISLEAVFEVIPVGNFQFTADIYQNQTAYGDITGTTTSGSYPENTEMILRATPKAGYKFKQWQGLLNNVTPILKTAANTTVALTGNITISAVFEKIIVTTYAFSKGVFDDINGTVSGTADGNYPPGTAITVIASPDEGYFLDYWWDTINTVSYNNPYTFFMPQSDVRVEAVFNAVVVPLGRNISTSIGILPAASEGISNKSSLPEGTSYSWEISPSVATLGNKNGTIKIIYPNGQIYYISIIVQVLQSISVKSISLLSGALSNCPKVGGTDVLLYVSENLNGVVSPIPNALVTFGSAEGYTGNDGVARLNLDLFQYADNDIITPTVRKNGISLEITETFTVNACSNACLNPVIQEVIIHQRAVGTSFPYFEFVLSDMAGTIYPDATELTLYYSFNGADWSNKSVTTVGNNHSIDFTQSGYFGTTFPIFFKVEVNGGTDSCDTIHSSGILEDNITLDALPALDFIFIPANSGRVVQGTDSSVEGVNKDVIFEINGAFEYVSATDGTNPITATLLGGGINGETYSFNYFFSAAKTITITSQASVTTGYVDAKILPAEAGEIVSGIGSYSLSDGADVTFRIYPSATLTDVRDALGNLVSYTEVGQPDSNGQIYTFNVVVTGNHSFSINADLIYSITKVGSSDVSNCDKMQEISVLVEKNGVPLTSGAVVSFYDKYPMPVPVSANAFGVYSFQDNLSGHLVGETIKASLSVNGVEVITKQTIATVVACGEFLADTNTPQIDSQGLILVKGDPYPATPLEFLMNMLIGMQSIAWGGSYQTSTVGITYWDIIITYADGSKDLEKLKVEILEFPFAATATIVESQMTIPNPIFYLSERMEFDTEISVYFTSKSTIDNHVIGFKQINMKIDKYTGTPHVTSSYGSLQQGYKDVPNSYEVMELLEIRYNGAIADGPILSVNNGSTPSPIVNGGYQEGATFTAIVNGLTYYFTLNLRIY